MTSPRELDRRVRQHHDEIIAIYELLEKTDEKVDKIDKKVDTIAEVQQEHGSTLDSILHTLETQETKLSVWTRSLRDVDHHMGRIEDIQRKQAKRLDSHNHKLDSHGEKLEEVLGLLRQER